jgi:hypothetical protein
MKLKLKPDLHVAVQTDFVAKLLYLLVLHLVLASLRLPKRVLFLSYYSAFRDRLQGHLPAAAATFCPRGLANLLTAPRLSKSFWKKSEREWSSPRKQRGGLWKIGTDKEE